MKASSGPKIARGRVRGDGTEKQVPRSLFVSGKVNTRKATRKEDDPGRSLLAAPFSSFFSSSSSPHPTSNEPTGAGLAPCTLVYTLHSDGSIKN